MFIWYDCHKLYNVKIKKLQYWEMFEVQSLENHNKLGNYESIWVK